MLKLRLKSNVCQNLIQNQISVKTDLKSVEAPFEINSVSKLHSQLNVCQNSTCIHSISKFPNRIRDKTPFKIKSVSKLQSKSIQNLKLKICSKFHLNHNLTGVEFFFEIVTVSKLLWKLYQCRNFT